MKKLVVMTIIGTRPELIKLSEVIKKCDQYFKHILVHTGQNYAYSLNKIFYEDMGIREPDYYLDVAGNNLGETIGKVIQKSYELLMKLKPEAILILGDTNSALCAISAKRLKIPIFHMEAGNRCFDENLPEEINRRIVDHISDVNIPYSEQARRNLLAEGIKAEFVFVSGSPMKEVLEAQRKKIDKSNVLKELGLEKGRYIVLSAHREENIDDNNNFQELVTSINIIAEHFHMPIIYSMHPRSEKKIKEKGIKFHKLVKEMKPFSFSDYNFLQENAYCVVSDSGTLAEESTISHFPAVSIRNSTERQEAFEKGNFILGGIKAELLVQSILIATNMKKDFRINVPEYSYENLSSVVVNIIQSYTQIVSEKIWNRR